VVAVTALLVLLQVVGLLHLALVPHRFCAEHGELIEGAAHRVAAHSERAAHTQAAVSSLWSGDGEPVENGDHLHCAFWVHQRDRLVQAPAALVVVDALRCPPVDAAPSPSDRAENLSAVPLLALAPKCSPPVA